MLSSSQPIVFNSKFKSQLLREKYPNDSIDNNLNNLLSVPLQAFYNKVSYSILTKLYNILLVHTATYFSIAFYTKYFICHLVSLTRQIMCFFNQILQLLPFLESKLLSTG